MCLWINDQRTNEFVHLLAQLFTCDYHSNNVRIPHFKPLFNEVIGFINIDYITFNNLAYIVTGL